jgi:hypothetical protein
MKNTLPIPTPYFALSPLRFALRLTVLKSNEVWGDCQQGISGNGGNFRMFSCLKYKMALSGLNILLDIIGKV